MGIGTRAHRIIAIIQISIVTIRIMHAISILYSSLCSLNAAMRTIALTSAIIAIPFHNHESSCINCIGSLPFWNLGSPPRVWGKANVTPCHGFYVGITPTCVGKRLKDIRKALHNPQIYSCPHSPSTFINTKEMIFVAQKTNFIKKLHLTARVQME